MSNGERFVLKRMDGVEQIHRNAHAWCAKCRRTYNTTLPWLPESPGRCPHPDCNNAELMAVNGIIEVEK